MSILGWIRRRNKTSGAGDQAQNPTGNVRDDAPHDDERAEMARLAQLLDRNTNPTMAEFNEIARLFGLSE